MTSPQSAIVEQFLDSETRKLNWDMTPDEIQQEGPSSSELTAKHSIGTDKLFALFESWVDENDVDQLSREAFDDAMEALGSDRVEQDEGFVWLGWTQD